MPSSPGSNAQRDGGRKRDREVRNVRTKKNRSRHNSARRSNEGARAAVAAVLAPVLAGAFGGIALEASIAPSASAASTFPGYTTSYYVDTTNTGTIGDLGCYDTGSSVSDANNVVIDFGQQIPDSASSTGWGTNTWDVGALPDYSGSTLRLSAATGRLRMAGVIATARCQSG